MSVENSVVHTCRIILRSSIKSVYTLFAIRCAETQPIAFKNITQLSIWHSFNFVFLQKFLWALFEAYVFLKLPRFSEVLLGFPTNAFLGFHQESLLVFFRASSSCLLPGNPCGIRLGIFPGVPSGTIISSGNSPRVAISNH